MARCLLQAKEPTKFWAEIIYYANYLLSLVPTRAINHVTPIKKWCAKKPLVDHLEMFVCIAWAHISNDCRKKLDAKNHVCIMIGYSEEFKAYRLFDLLK